MQLPLSKPMLKQQLANVRLTVKTKIWITVLTVVLMFAFFILFYFPALQETYLLKNYNKEIQNLANTVSLGVKIALTEQNFEGVQTAFNFVQKDPHLEFVSLIQVDTLWNSNHTNFKIEKKVFKTYPENIKVNTNAKTDEFKIVKRSAFTTPTMTGEIMLSLNTLEIAKSKKEIRVTSLIVSFIVFVVGILIGFLLARNISVPVLQLRDAANRVSEGDLTQRVNNRSRDEIGELGLAFNKMVTDLGVARREIEERTNDLMIEKRKSDELLLNILPAETVDELKATGVARAKSYDSVTVLFTDFKDFTSISENMAPDELVAELNYCFSAFDQIIEKYNIEKIKTIGDSYMCAAGLPVKNTTHPQDIVKAAIEMRDFMLNYRSKKIKMSGVTFEVRIGINTGPVVAGIVGVNKFAYDIWGNTVNIASRMESHSEPGRINISGSTYSLIQNDYNCTLRGKISTKGLGNVEMYFLDSVKEA